LKERKKMLTILPPSTLRPFRRREEQESVAVLPIASGLDIK